MSRQDIRLALQFIITEDMLRNGVPIETAPCFQQHLRLHDGGIPQAMRIDFKIFANASAIGVADVRGGEIDEMDLSIHRMDGGQMFAKSRKRLYYIQVAVSATSWQKKTRLQSGKKS